MCMRSVRNSRFSAPCWMRQQKNDYDSGNGDMEACWRIEFNKITSCRKIMSVQFMNVSYIILHYCNEVQQPLRSMVDVRME